MSDQHEDEAQGGVVALNLEDALNQQIELGVKDPIEIARKIADLYGPEWVVTQLAFYAQDLISELARHRLSARRRSAEIALRPGDQMATAELKLVSFWVPDEHGGHWKKAADATPEDLRTRAKHYDRLAVGSLRRSQWLNEVADLMDDEGAKTLGKLRMALPALPMDADLAELVA